jgi:hypothetical protein
LALPVGFVAKTLSSLSINSKRRCRTQRTVPIRSQVSIEGLIKIGDCHT